MKRNNAFDLLCGICIIRMIMLHVTQVCQMTENQWWQTIMQWSYFFMAFFFFKAGYFNKSVQGDTKAYIKDKAKRLLVPYLAWGIIGNIIYFSFVCLLPPNNYFCKQVNWEHLWNTSGFFGNNPLWFLFSFFMAYVIAHLLSKVPKIGSVNIKGKSIDIDANVLIIFFPLISYWFSENDNPLPYNLNNVVFGVFVFTLGRMWRRFIDRTKSLHVFLLSLLLMAIFIPLNYMYEGRYYMASNQWEGDFWIVLVNVCCVLCGISGILLSFKLPRIPLFNYIGEHSMVFFVTHQTVIMFYIMIRSLNVHTLKHHWDDYVILSIMIFSICFWLIPYVERTPILSGRFKKKK